MIERETLYAIFYNLCFFPSLFHIKPRKPHSPQISLTVFFLEKKMTQRDGKAHITPLIFLLTLT